jgi:ornithine cyclodeaminase/alanine dehydrogenase-like protein (mu-crystallin family)
MAAVLPLERVRVWSRSAERRAEFAAQCGERFGLAVEAAGSAEEAVRGADVIVTATNAGEPVLEAEWVSRGAHVNAMGSNQARRRELPGELVRGADLIVTDSVEQSRMESGDLLLALGEEDWARVVELQEVAAGRAGRPNADAITVFNSNGLAVEDVIAAGLVYERALAAGAR